MKISDHKLPLKRKVGGWGDGFTGIMFAVHAWGIEFDIQCLCNKPGPAAPTCKPTLGWQGQEDAGTSWPVRMEDRSTPRSVRDPFQNHQVESN